MNHPPQSVYQQVIEKTKGAFFRTQVLRFVKIFCIKALPSLTRQLTSVLIQCGCGEINTHYAIKQEFVFYRSLVGSVHV